MTQTTFKVSVVIPTYNRRESLLTLLDSLKEQKFSENIVDFEVVVSVDGSTDGTVDALVDRQQIYPFPLKIISSINRGRAVARNVGAKGATGDLLIFYDDDVRPNCESVQMHVSFHESHKKAILDGPGLYDQKMISGDFHRFRSNMETTWYLNLSHPIKKTAASINGGNWSISADLFTKVGGLDEDMTDSEDFEFGFRALHRFAIPIYHDYRAWVYHDDYKNLNQYLERKIDAYSTWGYLFKKHPDVLIIYADKFIYRPAFWKKTVLFLFGTNFCKFMANSPIFVKLVPCRLRDKVYKLMLTAANPTIWSKVY
jgi:glycosyltransferase involved in cell wall biosynthesis